MKAIDKSEFFRASNPVNAASVAYRRPINSLGINDADYMVTKKVNGKIDRCPAYHAWSNMMNRVCRANDDCFHSYIGTSISESWIRFSNFRSWWIEHYVDGYKLDKDLIKIGNMEYGPDNCVYVPNWINTFVIDTSLNRGDYLIGASIVKSTGMFKSRCRHPKSKVAEHLGHFSNEIDAHKAWMARKIEIANELKAEMDEIDHRIFKNVIEIITNSK